MTEPRKPTVTTAGIDPSLARALEPVKQCLELITGARSGVNELVGLRRESTLNDVVAKINEIISRINASGKNHV